MITTTYKCQADDRLNTEHHSFLHIANCTVNHNNIFAVTQDIFMKFDGKKTVHPEVKYHDMARKVGREEIET